MKNIFIIGPGGVGKTTCGKILASKLVYNFIDVDSFFMNDIGDINTHINIHGKNDYCHKNSELFYSLLDKNPDKTVFALSSGFLINNGINELNKKHENTIDKEGVSILLLPSEDLKESIDIIVQRQLSKGIDGTTRDKEIKKIKERFYEYKKYGKVKIFSMDKPEIIVDSIIEELKLL